MKIKEGYILKNSSGNYVVSVNDGNVKLNNSIVLTETAVFLWNLIKDKHLTKVQMLNELINNFDISTVLALGDIDIFIRTMMENDIIEE